MRYATKKRLVKAAVLCLALLCLVGCKKKEVSAGPQVEEIVYNVEVSPVETGSITETHRFGGTIKAKSTVSAMPDAAGKIVEVLVTEGEVVRKDQVLAYIDPSRAGQTYNKSPVKAPIAGTVTSVTGKVGQQTSQASAFATVETLDDLELDFKAIELYSAQITVGNPVVATFDAIPGEVFTGRVSKVSPTVNQTTRMADITVKLDKTDPRLKAGMYARLSVQMQTKTGILLVPYSALTLATNETYCYIEEGGRAVRKVVSVGIREGNDAEIVSGLSVGDRVIVKGQGFISDGDAVRVLN